MADEKDSGWGFLDCCFCLLTVAFKGDICVSYFCVVLDLMFSWSGEWNESKLSKVYSQIVQYHIEC